MKMLRSHEPTFFFTQPASPDRLVPCRGLPRPVRARDLRRPGAVQEIAQGAAVKVTGPDEVEVEFQPFESCIIVLQKKP